MSEKLYSTGELLKLALTVPDDNENYGGFKSEGKVFLPGNVTVKKPGDDTDKESKAISDCWSVLKNSLVEKYGGFLYLRKEIKMVDGVKVYTRYLDYLTRVPEKTDQPIRLGDNLLDLSYYLKTNQLVNSVKAVGWTTAQTGWFFWEKNTFQITREACNKASIEKYGLVQKLLVVEGTQTNGDSLKKRAEEELKKYTEAFAASIEVNAADLCDTGVDVDRLGFLKETWVQSEPHGIENWLPCVKEVLPLDAPEEKTFTFGSTTQKLSSMQAANFGTAGKAWNAIQSTIGYMNK